MKNSKWNYKLAIVRYMGKSDNDFTYGQLYVALSDRGSLSAVVLIVTQNNKQEKRLKFDAFPFV